jgi:hypothetical protein
LVTSDLPVHALRFLRQSELIDWDTRVVQTCQLTRDVAHILHAAALIEQDTAITARQARSLGIDSSADIGAFLSAWEREEAEHSRALHYLSENQAYTMPASRLGSIPPRRRLLAKLPAGPLRWLPQTEFVYCALGAAGEYVALVSYTEVQKLIDDAVAVALLREIIRQEGRHLAFFMDAARVRAVNLSTLSGHTARYAFKALWEPVGVPSLGIEAWRDVFAPLLKRESFRKRLTVMDRVIDTIPPLHGLGLMTNFLADQHIL